MQMIIFDENKNKIDTLQYNINHKINQLKKDQNIPDIDENTKDILNSLDYSIGVYYLSKDQNNFNIIFLNDMILRFNKLNLEKIRGMSFSDIYFHEENDEIIINSMKKVYKTNKPENFFFEYYDDYILSGRYDVTIKKIGNFIYIFGKNEPNYINLDYANLPMEQENLFTNNYNAIAILQDGHFVKVNKKYLEVYNQPNYETVIGQKLGYTGVDKNLIKDVLKNFQMILDQKMDSYLFPIEINKNGKLIHYFNLNCSYTLYKSEPAIIIVHHDLTKEEINKRELENKTKEAITLSNNLDFIQSVSNTGISYRINNKYTRSPQMYNILERDFIKADSYRNILLDFTIEEDKSILKENFQKLGLNKDSTDFIVRINTAKGNLKYIHCYVRMNYLENNQEYTVLFYQDVTREQKNLKKLYNALTESKRLNNNLKKIHGISKTGIGYYYEKNSKDNQNSSFKLNWNLSSFDTLKLYGRKYENYQGDLSEIILKEDLPNWNKAHLKCTSKHPETTVTIRVINGEGDVRYVKCYIVYDYENDYNNGRVIFFQDITKEIEKENKLKIALKDKEMLLTEVHHRVKNNLQIILSLINLNRGYDSNPETILTDTETRIYAMALIHEKIYGSSSLADVNIKEYVESLADSLLDTYKSNINLHYEMEPVNLTMEKSIPLGLIINELVTNTIKHAFPNKKEGNLFIVFKKEDNKFLLIVKDDGIGLSDDFNIDDLSSLGLIVVQNLVLQIDGILSIITCNGTEFKIEFE